MPPEIQGPDVGSAWVVVVELERAVAGVARGEHVQGAPRVDLDVVLVKLLLFLLEVAHHLRRVVLEAASLLSVKEWLI